ncbi:PIN domain-containing protein [Candidatus Bathyarchaeota archaeon]|nr:MAG: PIN domain-containing protein [Candidatus Bathyarchaeota archaeon]
MRFIDSNVFIHAYIKPKRKLKEHERRIKERAKAIIKSVNNGEEVLTTVVHISEIANLLEDFMPLKNVLDIVLGILLKSNIHVVEVSYEDYLTALSIAEKAVIGLNDALAYVIMLQKGVKEIYSFDKDFDKLGKTLRVTEPPTGV